MQIIIDLTEEELARLEEISAAREVTRDELVKSAIEAYVHAQPRKMAPEDEQRALHQAFGLWKDMNEEGLEYQDRMRSEW